MGRGQLPYRPTLASLLKKNVLSSAAQGTVEAQYRSNDTSLELRESRLLDQTSDLLAQTPLFPLHFVSWDSSSVGDQFLRSTLPKHRGHGEVSLRRHSHADLPWPSHADFLASRTLLYRVFVRTATALWPLLEAAYIISSALTMRQAGTA